MGLTYKLSSAMGGHSRILACLCNFTYCGSQGCLLSGIVLHRAQPTKAMHMMPTAHDLEAHRSLCFALPRSPRDVRLRTSFAWSMSIVLLDRCFKFLIRNTQLIAAAQHCQLH